MTLDELKMGEKKKSVSIFHWLRSLFVKQHGTAFVPPALEAGAVSVARIWLLGSAKFLLLSLPFELREWEG